MSGLATMESKACGKMGMITITYYLWTTFMAVTVGIILVVSIHPGAAAQKDDYSVGKVVLSSADALLDLIRYITGFQEEPSLWWRFTDKVFPQGTVFPGGIEISRGTGVPLATLTRHWYLPAWWHEVHFSPHTSLWPLCHSHYSPPRAISKEGCSSREQAELNSLQSSAVLPLQPQPWHAKPCSSLGFAR